MTLEWIFDPAPPSGSRKGGLAGAQVFPSDIDSFVREVLQNARDQKLADVDKARVRFTLEELTASELEYFVAGIGWAELSEHVEAAAKQGYVTISPRLREVLGRSMKGSCASCASRTAGRTG